MRRWPKIRTAPDWWQRADLLSGLSFFVAPRSSAGATDGAQVEPRFIGSSQQHLRRIVMDAAFSGTHGSDQDAARARTLRRHWVPRRAKDPRDKLRIRVWHGERILYADRCWYGHWYGTGPRAAAALAPWRSMTPPGDSADATTHIVCKQRYVEYWVDPAEVLTWAAEAFDRVAGKHPDAFELTVYLPTIFQLIGGALVVYWVDQPAWHMALVRTSSAAPLPKSRRRRGKALR